VIEPWPYGGLDVADENRRYFQGLIFAVDTSSGNADSNFYPFPLPIIPIMDWLKREIIRIEEIATGGKGDSLTGKSHAEGVLDHCRTAEYVPELLSSGVRTDLKELSVVQPDGPSFTVTDDSLVEWQKWRFRVTFNPREGAVLHDIHYDGRSVLYRLSFSEMVSSCLPSKSSVIHSLMMSSLFHTPILAHRSIASRPSTLVMVVSDIARTI